MNGQPYEISFTPRAFSDCPKHVLVVLRRGHQFVLTKHKIRGLEFPGGKVETNETALQAVHREVCEETGCTVKNVREIGQYRIPSLSKDFVKSIFTAEVQSINPNHTFLETEGLYFFDALTEEILSAPSFSFIMQDGVALEILAYLQNTKPQNEHPKKKSESDKWLD